MNSAKTYFIVLGMISIFISSCSPKRVSSLNYQEGLNCYVRTDTTISRIGDFIYLFFVIENNSDTLIYAYNYYQTYYVDNKPIGGYNVTIRDELGELIPRIDPRMVGGIGPGRIGIVAASRDESIKARIRLWEHYQINKPGKYEVTVKLTFPVYMGTRKLLKRRPKIRKLFIKYHWSHYKKVYWTTREASVVLEVFD